MLRVAFALFVILPSVGTAQDRGGTTEFGMTPNHVYALWTNINEALLAVARIAAADGTWDVQVSSLDHRAFVDKVPADVLVRAEDFRDRLNRLRVRAAMEPTPPFESPGTVVTPSDVFMNSGHMLDGVVEWIIEMTPPQWLISPFYLYGTFGGKQPNDVFEVVDLAVRRLDLILVAGKS